MLTSTIARLSLAGVIAIAGVGSASMASLADDGITKTYVGGNDVGVVNPLAANFGCTSAATPAINGDCFDIQDGTIDVTVVDQSGNKMNVAVGYKDTTKGTTGAIVKTDYICGSAKGLTVPTGASIAFISIVNGVKPALPGTPATNPSDATQAACGSPGIGTTGTIKVTGSGLVMDSPTPRISVLTASHSGSRVAMPAAAAARVATRGVREL